MSSRFSTQKDSQPFQTYVRFNYHLHNVEKNKMSSDWLQWWQDWDGGRKVLTKRK